MNTLVEMIGKAYFRALGYYPTNIDGLNFKLDPDHFLFWGQAAKGRWEPHTFNIISKFINLNTVYCDLGAWIGPTVICAARKCKQVICFEPDPVAYRYLCRNIELNKLNNVMPINIALSNSTGIKRISSFGKRLGDSQTSLLADGHENNGAYVVTLTWEDFIKIFKIDSVDFLKIDIEGGEFNLLPTLKEYLSLHKPIVYLSTHPQFLDDALREKSMCQIMDVMSIYKKCLNRDFELIDINELINEDSINQGHSYIFMD
jgi:FkbM family methyltransferase